MFRHPLVHLFASMVAAMVAALIILTVSLAPPRDDIRLLTYFMLGSGSTTVLLAYTIYRQGMRRWFTSLRWVLITSIVITVLLVVPNVWVTAQLMFISPHDFYLTSALLVFAGITAVSFGLFVSNALAARIMDLSTAAKAVAQGKLDTRLAVSGKDELSDFAHTFNWMAESLKNLDDEKRMVEQTRRNLIAGISHDLRTPLTSMRAMLEALADGIVTEKEEQSRYIENSLAEIANLDHMIDDLFELAQLDAGHMKMEFVSASLRDLISDVMSSMNAQATRHQLTFKGEISPEIDPVYMAPDKIQRVLINLLDNALRYTPPQGTITIRAKREGEKICVEVHNTDTVIAPEDIPQIFNSFYRVERSRNRAEDGHRSSGLGLAIARGLVEAHQGNISVESRDGQGTTFRFSIPRGKAM